MIAIIFRSLGQCQYHFESETKVTLSTRRTENLWTIMTTLTLRISRFLGQGHY